MTRSPWAIACLVAMAFTPSMTAQTVSRTAPKPSAASEAGAKALASAFANNPITAPYGIKVEIRKGKYVLKGKVGTTDIHNTALRIAIDSGLPFSDEMVTDTGEVYRSAVTSDGPVPILGGSPLTSRYEWLYPEPLFGRVDEPFAGMDPPAISYPPDWAARKNRLAAAVGQVPNYPLPPNTVEMTIDPRGVALLRGRVPTVGDRVMIGQQLAQTPGVSGIINQLDTENSPPQPGPSRARNRSLSDTPPPPPRPMPIQTGKEATPVEQAPPANAARPAPVPAPAASRNVNPLETRVNQSVQRVPDLRGVAVRIKAADGGVVSLGGKVAGIHEAMLAYRAVQTTPGVTAVVDSLEFPPPEESKRNPLAVGSSPDDVEPYLEAQLARQLGDLAHVDRLTVNGDKLDLKATLDREDDRARAEAILRSLPILRGFKVDHQFKVRP